MKTRFFTIVPFSVYLGWITVATIANITAVLVNIGWFGDPFSEVFWTILVISAAVIIAGLFLFFEHDWAIAAVVVWSLLGIVLKRNSIGDTPGIVVTAAIGMAMIIIFAIMRKVLIHDEQ